MRASQPLTFTFLGLISFFGINQASAQGCVAIRHFSSFVGNILENNLSGSEVKQTEEITEEPRQGGAAFANYLKNVAVLYRFAGSKVKVDSELIHQFNN